MKLVVSKVQYFFGVSILAASVLCEVLTSGKDIYAIVWIMMQFALVSLFAVSLLPVLTSEEYREAYRKNPAIQFKVGLDLLLLRESDFSLVQKLLFAALAVSNWILFFILILFR